MDTPTPAPIRIGMLFDFPQVDGGESVVAAARLGLEDATAGGRLDRSIELIYELANGLPLGTAADIEDHFDALDDERVLAIIGPSISDNGLIVRELAEGAKVPCINYTGGAMTRSAWMFHYQVGSLEEEPIALAEHLATTGAARVGVVFDESPVGRRYADSFEAARAGLGLQTTATVGISPVQTQSSDLVERLRSSNPDAIAYLGMGLAARALAVELKEAEWSVPVVGTSALMFGYQRKEWRADWEGWVYVDTLADDNPQRQALRERSRATAAGPVGVAAYDIGRLLGEGLVRCQHLTRDGLREGLERVKRLPATSGHAGTTMGFGCWDHGALKGEYLVLRQWRDGRSVQVAADVKQ
jgi:branched-chain amino acid transport system substrate-binding protein